MAKETKKNQNKGNTFEEYILERLKNTEAEAATYLNQVRLMAQQIKDLKESRDEAIAKLNALKSVIQVREVDWLGKPGWSFSMPSIYPSDDDYKKVEEILIVEERRRDD